MIAAGLLLTHSAGTRRSLVWHGGLWFGPLPMALVIVLSVMIAHIALPAVAIVLGLAAFAILLYVHPWLIWAATGLVLPLSSRFRFGPASATDLFLIVAILIWIAQSMRDRRLPLYRHRALPVLCLYIATLAASTYLAHDLGEALTEMIKWMQFALVLALLPARTASRHAYLVISGLLLGGIGQALLGIYQFIFQIGPEWFTILGSFARASGSFRQPNPYAGYLGLTLPVAFVLALWSFHRWQAAMYRPYALGPFLWYGCAFLLIAAGMLASWSRGGWLGAAAAIVVTFLATRANLRMGLWYAFLLVSVSVVVVLAAPSVLPTPIQERVSDIPAYMGFGDVLAQPTTDTNFSVQERLAHWVAAQRMWSLSPWLGVGVGNYAFAYPSVRLLAWEEPLGHAHNYYLNVLAETGILGFVTFAVVWIVLCIRAATAVFAAHRMSLQWAIGAGLLGLLAHLAVHSLVDNLFVQGIYLHIALWFALLEITGNVSAPDRSQ